MGLSRIQEAAVLTAIKKAVSARLEEVRAEADDDLLGLYEQTGADRIKVTVGDTEIGTFSLSFAKDGYEVVDQRAFEGFCLANGLADEVRSIKPEYTVAACDVLERELPEAVQTTVRTRKDIDRLLVRVGDAYVVEGTSETVPGIIPKHKAVKGTTLRGCDPKTAIPALTTAEMQGLLLGDAS